MSEIVIEKTPFVFEDGNIYYFEVTKRRSSNEFHDLWVYEKITKDIKFFWFKKTIEKYRLINESSELINAKLSTYEIKSDIKKILIAKKVKTHLKDWDGFVGDVPHEMKQALKREAKLNNILGN
jgi:hypothetical protein